MESNEQRDNRQRNPYEDADLISMSPRTQHEEIEDHPATFNRPRSRNVQSARDSASQHTNQERLDHLDAGDAPRINPAHTPTSGAVERPGARAPRQTYTPQARGTQTPEGGYTPLATASAYDTGVYSMRTRRRSIVPVLALVILLLAAAGGIALWLNRPVTVTVNGVTCEVARGSRLVDVMSGQRISTTPGNYVTVSGNVLEAGTGYAFSASVNGKALTPNEADEFRVEGNEAIDFSDGGDRIEDYSATVDVQKPYLKMDGSGYSIQYISQWAQEGEIEHRVGKVSGEKADVVTKEAKDCVITCRDLQLEGDTKYVALTFDDGPADPYTAQYLDILDRYGAKATFFNLGDNVNLFPDLARRIVESGHQLANHTMSHHQLTAVDADTIFSEIQKSADAIKQATDVTCTHIRPPYGDFTERSWLATRGIITAAIRWDCDSEDWKLPGAQAIVDGSMKSVHSGSIILMHDGGGDRAQDVEALPMLIERLQADGYQLVTVSELMRMAGDIPEDVCSGTTAMPEDAIWPDEISPEDIAAAEGA